MNKQNDIDIAKITKEAEKSFYIKFFAITIVAILFWVIVIGYGMKKDKNSKEDTYFQCYYYSQNLVKSKLKSPKSADFPWYSDSFIEDKGDTIIVSAYVDADNSFGASVRVHYKAKIKVEYGEPVSGTVTLIE